jgi:hypothetical protein
MAHLFGLKDGNMIKAKEAALLCLALFTLTACGAEHLGLGLKATGFTESRGLGFIDGYSVKQITTNSWEIRFTGNEVTSPERAYRIAKVRAAQVALQNGFSYITFTHDIQVNCVQQNGLAIAASPRLTGIAQASNEKISGSESAQNILDELLDDVKRDPDSQQRGVAFSQLRQSCYR